LLKSPDLTFADGNRHEHIRFKAREGQTGFPRQRWQCHGQSLQTKNEDRKPKNLCGKFMRFPIIPSGARRLRSFGAKDEARKEAEKIARQISSGDATAATMRNSEAARFSHFCLQKGGIRLLSYDFEIYLSGVVKKSTFVNR
jgi:hypothetical protein